MEMGFLCLSCWHYFVEKEKFFFFLYSGETTLGRRWVLFTIRYEKREVLLLSCSACTVQEWKCFSHTVASLQK